MIPVVGIDPSLSMTGLARLDSDGVATRRIRTPPADGTVLSSRRRLRWIVSNVLAFVGAGECLTVIEQPAFSRGGQGMFVERCGLYWLLVDQMCAHGPVVAVTPKGRAKYATGNGNADKKAVLAAMRDRFPGVPIPDDNVADALSLLGMGARHQGAPIDGELTAQHIAAMTAPVWPLQEGKT